MPKVIDTLEIGLKPIWAAVCGIVRSQAAYDDAVSAIAKLCAGSAAAWNEKVYKPILEYWEAQNPVPGAPPKTATKAVRAEHALAVADRERALRNMRAAMCYLKMRAGLRIKRTGTKRGKKRTGSPNAVGIPDLVIPAPEGKTGHAYDALVKRVVGKLAESLGATVGDTVALIIRVCK